MFQVGEDGEEARVFVVRVEFLDELVKRGHFLVRDIVGDSALQTGETELLVTMGRMGHFQEETDVASQLSRVGTGPFVELLALQERHEGWGCPDAVFHANVHGSTDVDFDEGGFGACFLGEFVVRRIHHFARRTGGRGEEDDGA